MPVIKSQQAATLIRDAIVLDLGDLERQAERLKEHAEQRARHIVSTAEQRAAETGEQLRRQMDEMRQSVEKQAHAEGLAQGRADGLEQGRTKARQEVFDTLQPRLEEAAAALSQAAQAFDAQRTQTRRDAERTVVQFALKLAEKLVHRAIEVDQEVVVDQVAGALGLVLRPMNVAVRVHPDDQALVQEALPDLLRNLRQLDHVDVIDDDTINRGGCIVTYGQGCIDATIEKQMTRIVEQMLPMDDERLDEVKKSIKSEDEVDPESPSDGNTSVES